MLRSSFPLSLLVSVLLHGLLLGAGELTHRFAATPIERPAVSRLDARLLPTRAIAVEEPLLKSTLVETDGAPAASPALSPRAGRSAVSRAVRASSAVERSARRKLAEHMFYPPEAIEQGLEGEVRLLLRLAPDGAIVDAQIASGSGHALLDRAALDAARAMRRLPEAGVAELILPVVFKLQ